MTTRQFLIVNSFKFFCVVKCESVGSKDFEVNLHFLSSRIQLILVTFMPEHVVRNSSYLLLFRWSSWLRSFATSRRVAGLVPNSVTGIIHWHYHSGCTMILVWTQSIIRMSTRKYFLGVMVACFWCLQSHYTHVPTVLKSRSFSLLEYLEPVHACNWIASPLLLLFSDS